MSVVSTQAWLEEVATSCTSTLTILHDKAAKTKVITESDNRLSEICMAYLYVLHRLSQEGLLDLPEAIDDTLNYTIH